MLLYYITDRGQFPGDEAARRRRLVEKVGEAARCGVDYIQLREKDLSSRELELLAREAVKAVRTNAHLRTENRDMRTALLINSRTDVVLASGADGVHLPAKDISPSEVREIWTRSLSSSSSPHRGLAGASCAVIGVSCHSIEEVRSAAGHSDFAVFGPVFEKRREPGSVPCGVAALQQACAEKIPVFALGGVTLENAEACRKAGAAGIAGVRLFQENDIRTVVEALAGAPRA